MSTFDRALDLIASLVLEDGSRWGEKAAPFQWNDARAVLGGEPPYNFLTALADPLWRANEIPGPAPWLDPERLAEQRRRLPESVYRRLFENEWTAAEDRLVSPDDLAACVTLDGPLPAESGRKYVIGLDLGLRRDRTVAVICHSEPILSDDGEGRGVRVVLDRLHVWQGHGRGTRFSPTRSRRGSSGPPATTTAPRSCSILRSAG